MTTGPIDGADERNKRYARLRKYKQQLKNCEESGAPANHVQPDEGEAEFLVQALVSAGNEAMMDDSRAPWAEEVFEQALTVQPDNVSASTGLRSVRQRLKRMTP